MADLKISEMTPAAELTGAELIECVQGGVNVKQELTGLKTWVNDGVQPFSSTLDALSSFNTNGIMVQTDTSEFIGRTITGTASQVTVTNGDGASGNPTIGLPASGVTAASYGSSSTIPVLTVNAQGILTAASTAAVGTTFSDSAFRIQDNADATKQIAFEASSIDTGTTKTITMPNADVDLGNLPQSYATTSLRTGTQAAPSSSGATTTAYGYRAGFATTTGSANTFVGTNAGLAVTTASGGVFVGYNAGSTVTTGTGNTIVGSSAAGSLATTANSIVVIGASAGTKVGSSSVAIGSSANTNSTGTGTISIGDASGIHPLVTTSTSSNWVAIGSQAGQSLTASSVGGGWVAIGNLTGANNTSGDWVAIGNGAGAKANTDGSTSWVAIGVNANKNNFNDYGIAIGANAGYGSVANNRGTADSNNIFIGQSASRDSSVASGTAISDSLAIGRSATVAASNSFVLGSSGVPIKVGINMTTPTARLHLPAGSTSASSAPIKLTTGALLTTPEAGTFEFLSPNLYFTGVSTRWNFGDASFIATTNGNVLSGTRTRILGGSYNTVSGTDNVVVMGTNNTLNTSEVVVEGADWYNTTLFPLPRQTVKSSKASATTSKRVIRSTVCLTSGPDGIDKYATVDGTQTLGASYLPKAVAYDAAKTRRATHKITAMVHSDGNVEGGFFERIVRVTQLNAGSTAIADSKIVVTDTNDFGLSFNYGLTITLSASAGDALLKIVGTCTSISGGTPNNCSVSCVVESIYHIDS